MLNALVKHAAKNGFNQELSSMLNDENMKQNDELYNTLVDFINFLEESLTAQLDQNSEEENTEQVLMPMIQQLNNDAIDFQTLQTSIQKTREHLETTSSNQTNQTEKVEYAKNVLFEQILKNWKPTKNDPLH